MWQFWVDRGGTFTDIVGLRSDGEIVTHKLLSENSEHYRDAAVQGIRDIMGLTPETPIPPSTIEAVKMGTTVATNALLERKGDRTLLLITKGFGDLLRIGYQTRPNLFALQIILPELLYERVNEVPERLDAEGGVVLALDDAAAPRTATCFPASESKSINSLEWHQNSFEILLEIDGDLHSPEVSILVARTILRVKIIFLLVVRQVRLTFWMS